MMPESRERKLGLLVLDARAAVRRFSKCRTLCALAGIAVAAALVSPVQAYATEAVPTDASQDVAAEQVAASDASLQATGQADVAVQAPKPVRPQSLPRRRQMRLRQGRRLRLRRWHRLWMPDPNRWMRPYRRLSPCTQHMMKPRAQRAMQLRPTQSRRTPRSSRPAQRMPRAPRCTTRR